MYIYNLVHILERATAKEPEKIAFKYLENTLSFSQLHKQSTQLALHLIENGVNIGDRIGIYMPRCMETAIAVYGILKTGAVYVPLDPFSPESRTEFVIKDCDINYIISIPQQTRKLKKITQNLHRISIVGIEKEITNTISTSWEEIFSKSIQDYKPINILGDDLAYILYTSGSTGVPKGIMHTHNSALAFVKLVSDLYDMNDAVYGMHAPLHFDPSVQGYFAAPYALATTIIVSDAHTKMPSSLSELIEKEKITIWMSVPLALIQMLLRGNLQQKDFSSLKWVLFSGEVFPTKHLHKLMEVLPVAKFSNIYGPTETNQCTYYHVEKISDVNKTIPIGKVWGNTEFKIIDTNDHEVPYGDAGELVIRTATMMKGYWNNLDLTKNSFYKEEKTIGAPKIYYRTGDQVKLDSQDRLLFLGRNDHQVKIRGYRIELEEINNVFTSYLGVEEAITFVTSIKKSEEKLLKTVILTGKKTTITIEDVKQFSKTKLPHYAVPDRIFFFEEFPRTASGKINRKELEKRIASL